MSDLTPEAEHACAFMSPRPSRRRCEASAPAAERFDGFHLRRRRDGVGHEEIHRQRLRRVDAIALEVGDAAFGEKTVVDQESPGEFARRAAKDRP
jgi:hypothetical protein